MSTPMHFRKRQLLEYQIEANSTQLQGLQQTHIPETTNYSNILEPEITFEYPMSPASIGSERQTPTEHDENVTPDPNEYSTEQLQALAKQTVALLEMDSKSNKDAQKLTQITESLTALENFAKNSTINLPGGIGQIKYDTSNVLHIAFNLKQIIEDYINQEIATANKSTLSTLILAKLNHLRVNALLKPKKDLEPPQSPPALAIDMPQDLSMKSRQQEKPLSVDDDDDYEEPNLVIDESYVDGDDDGAPPSSAKTKHGVLQLASRISGIFSFINRTQSRMEQFMRQGINVVTLKPANKSKKKSSSHSKKSKNPHHKSNLKELQLQPKRVLTTIPEQKPWTNCLDEVVECKSKFPIPSPFDKSRVILGLNGTTISTAEWSQVDWDLTPAAVTRKILMMVFDREHLATHSLTGRPSPAFLELNYPEKKPLNPYIVQDIVDLVTSRTIATTKEVRMAITTKCADESKMRRGREARLNKQNENLRMKPY